jgi:cellulose synthase/poly-beta-1,6-N-acetylglucosamine synthase-like glycosyltransferase
MGQVLVNQLSSSLENSFSVGICAADHATKLGELIDLIKREPYPEGFVLKSIIVVGSGLDHEASAALRQIGGPDPEVVIIEEPFRRGKAEAINRIVEAFKWRFLVLVNSDAQPEQGAIAKLLSIIAGDDDIGVVSASPVLWPRTDLAGAILQIMWRAHNECLLTLSNENSMNHCCDELIVLRSEAIRKLPSDTVNDGAFLAGAAYQDGYVIQHCESAHVRIDVPVRLPDLLMQRRRIIYGHFQIRRRVGVSPRTIESMLIVNPLLSLSIMIRTIAKSPRLIFALPVAVIAETFSVAMAIGDTITNKAKHVPWARFGRMS